MQLVYGYLVCGEQDDSDCREEEGFKVGQRFGLEGFWCQLGYFDQDYSIGEKSRSLNN